MNQSIRRGLERARWEVWRQNCLDKKVDVALMEDRYVDLWISHQCLWRRRLSFELNYFRYNWRMLATLSSWQLGVCVVDPWREFPRCHGWTWCLGKAARLPSLSPRSLPWLDARSTNHRNLGCTTHSKISWECQLATWCRLNYSITILPLRDYNVIIFGINTYFWKGFTLLSKYVFAMTTIRTPEIITWGHALLYIRPRYSFNEREGAT